MSSGNLLIFSLDFTTGTGYSHDMKALVITKDKRVSEADLPDLTAMQAVVGGYIEPVDLSFGTLWCNEEYLFTMGPDDVNWTASDICGVGGRQDFLFRPLLGDVFITGGTDRDGNTLDYTEAALRAVKRVAREAGAEVSV